MPYDDFSIRMKAYEAFETERRFIPLLPVYARLDGRSFSAFTKGMERPFDPRMTAVMIATTKHLVQATHAKIGYTQSDEISLVWRAGEYKESIFFDGRVMKMASVLASMTTAAFTKFLLESELAPYAKKLPHFDGRVLSFPTETEAANMFLWRVADATKNAISMAARHYYSHKALHGKNGAEMQEMLFQKGVNFNDYPTSFKRGTFVRRTVERQRLPEATLAKLAALGKNDLRPDGMYDRSVVKEIDMPIFSKVTNRTQVIFQGDDPILTIES